MGADLRDGIHGRAEIEVDAFDFELARVDLGEVQDVVDQREEVPTGTVTRFSVVIRAELWRSLWVSNRSSRLGKMPSRPASCRSSARPAR
jgi:hypothetical protein